MSNFSALHGNYTVMCLTLATITKNSNEKYTRRDKAPEILSLNVVIKTLVFSLIRNIIPFLLPLVYLGVHILCRPLAQLFASVFSVVVS